MNYFSVCLAVFSFSIILYRGIIAPLYAIIYKKPLFIHFYPFPKNLSLSQLEIISKNFTFYKKLSTKEKVYFEHRVATFIKKYKFYAKEGLVITDEMRVLVAATAIMLTFGFKNYLFTVIDKIIMYPDIYYSKRSDNYHKGEFNPMMRAVVFSWKHFLEGYDISNDNLNLGLHEFTHVMHFQSLKSKDVSAVLFTEMYTDIIKQIQYPENAKKLKQSNYFRDYAYTNNFEFIAVALEHFFETPQQFQSEFPELYQSIKKMINFSEK